METGWLIDNGSLCLGADFCNDRLTMVPYTDPRAIRFARKQDAEAMIRALFYCLFMTMDDDRKWFQAVEHSWG